MHASGSYRRGSTTTHTRLTVAQGLYRDGTQPLRGGGSKGVQGMCKAALPCRSRESVQGGVGDDKP